jgi:hydroxymethylpyrimidine/phosphomethylpyrimidine kinase
MVATSGARLLKEEAVKILCSELLPVTGLITPNIPEALLLLEATGHKVEDIRDLDGMKQLAKAVSELGPKSVLIKGGHIPLKKNYTVATTDDEKEVLINVLYTGGDFCIFESNYQVARNTHGTGCSLACKYLHFGIW